ncbi:MAG: zeta toxin family protein [Thermoanaerobaculia bacterium]
MPDPVLHLIAGPNGAGKTTFYERVLGPATGLPFVNADVIAQERWPEAPAEHAYEAAEVAARVRRELIRDRHSFAAETVFSHPSKVDLVREAQTSDYLVTLHAILIPEELAVTRVRLRRELGGHDVPEEKIRARFRRLWRLTRQATALTHEAEILDNSRASRPFRRVAHYYRGELMGTPDWPAWTPSALLDPDG